MVLVTASTRSGRARRFLMVRRIGCAVCRQPEPVGLGSARRMPNHLGKIRTRHRREDRLRGVIPQTPGGTRKPTRTSPLSPADHPRHTRLGSRDDGSVPLSTPASPKTCAIADQNTTVELMVEICGMRASGLGRYRQRFRYCRRLARERQPLFGNRSNIPRCLLTRRSGI
jgi:hypothetical protein